MEAMFKSIFKMFVSSAEAITMFMAIINSLARSGVERAVVVEKKSIAAAALSELDNANNVAIRLDEITDVQSGISPESFNRAKTFLEEYQAKRHAEITGTILRPRTPDSVEETKGKK